ncbi:MAG TPA: hypothetical protein VHU41_12890 [Thermoanaerobaculia bacterium]|jgi:hypothetical protein|nr:hypothetical protein [Thermoanaerobaculia bacterium]
MIVARETAAERPHDQPRTLRTISPEIARAVETLLEERGLDSDAIDEIATRIASILESE